MRIYLSLAKVPELAPLGPSQRQQVHRICYCRHSIGRPRWILATALFFVCALLGGLPAFWLRFYQHERLEAWQMLVGVALGSGVGWVLRTSMITSFLRPFYAACVSHDLGGPQN